VAELGWERLVIKPAVDLGAMNLVRVDAEMAERLLARYERPVLIQPFLPSVSSHGEASLVYLGGELSHSLRKRPAGGDFRVQPLYGGTHEAIEPSAAELHAAERALAVSPGDPLYARVDLIPGEDGSPLVIELELIEPSLYLDVEPRGADVLARAMLERAAGGSRVSAR
jgi:glutathione synthase/RimK-type ligase-like ATP-grasp enzyme